jgi:hypothetical protein
MSVTWRRITVAPMLGIGCIGFAAAAACAAPLPLEAPFVLTPDACPSALYPCSYGDPVVVGTPGGRFLVGWVRTDVHPMGSSTLLARLFRSSGSAPRPEIQLNTGLPPYALPPAAAIDANGSYLVTWSNGSAAPDAVLARHLSAYGQPLGDPFFVAGAVSSFGGSAGQSADQAPAIAASPDGGFVVAWLTFMPPYQFFDGSPPEIVAQRYGAAGAPVGEIIAVSVAAGTVGAQGPAACTDSDGGTVLAWVSARSHIIPTVPPADAGVSARRLAADGSVTGGEIVVAPPNGLHAAVAVGCGARGSFLVVWQSDQVAGVSGASMLAQHFNRAGQPVGGGPYRLNTTGIGTSQAPALSLSPDGTFVVVWEDESGSGHLVGRRVAGNGRPLSAEFEIASGLGPGIRQAAISHYGTAGEFIVVWSQSAQLFARRYAAGPNP